MKNIHILPTDRPSRLSILNSGKLNFGAEIMSSSNSKPQHIYITSDEEIKKGDWFIMNGCIVRQCESTNKEPHTIHTVVDNTGGIHHVSVCQKIILTTDQVLISNGVQAIDDEFLEWFVNNPSCEWVEIMDDIKYFNIDELRERHVKGLPHLYSEKIGYKIIIPKEELTISDVAKQRAKNYMSLKGALEPKQETLEEAAEIFVNNRFTKQICGDESYPDIYASKKSIIESHIIFAKSQGKIMYSEEEVHKILCKSHNAESTSIIANTLKKWLEQFKKEIG